MILFFENGDQIRGDAIKRAIVRSDLLPIPLSLEASFLFDNDLVKRLSEGSKIFIGSMGKNSVRIVFSSISKSGNESPSFGRTNGYISIVALLDCVAEASFVRSRAIGLENIPLSTVYRASGCAIGSINNDFSIKSFHCFIGDIPTFFINQALQENGGVVGYRNDKIVFSRTVDIVKEEAVAKIQNTPVRWQDSGFQERIETPKYFSVNDDGNYVGDFSERQLRVKFSPRKNASNLANMRRLLINQGEVKLPPSFSLSAGDNVSTERGIKTILTAAHVYETGNGVNQYTKLWLGGGVVM